MKLAEHVPAQGMWQIVRGIGEDVNGKWCTDRIRDEIDEAAAETDPLKAVEELIDVLIITFGGMYQAATEAGIPFEELDKMLALKLQKNDAKYPVSLRAEYGNTEEYIAAMRLRWLANMDTGEVESDS